MEEFPVKAISAVKSIDILREVFAGFGVPITVVLDNATFPFPPFHLSNSTTFRDFMTSNNINLSNHRTIQPLIDWESLALCPNHKNSSEENDNWWWKFESNTLLFPARLQKSSILYYRCITFEDDDETANKITFDSVKHVEREANAHLPWNLRRLIGSW